MAPCQLSAFYARLSADAVSLAGAIMVLLPPSTLYDAVKKATVAVVKSIPGKSPFPYSIVGSGFCIDPDGIIVTCEHVFRDFFTPENREREKQARQAAPGETFTGNCVIPYALFYLGVQEKEHRVASALVPVRHAVKDEKHGFDLALLRLPRPDKQVFPEGYPTFSIADYAELHEMMEIATCGFPLGEALHHQIGTLTSSFTKGMISSIIPAQGVAREHVRGFQLDLTATNGNSGGPVFSAETGRVMGFVRIFHCDRRSIGSSPMRRRASSNWPPSSRSHQGRTHLPAFRYRPACPLAGVRSPRKPYIASFIIRCKRREHKMFFVSPAPLKPECRPTFAPKSQIVFSLSSSNPIRSSHALLSSYGCRNPGRRCDKHLRSHANWIRSAVVRHTPAIAMPAD